VTAEDVDGVAADTHTGPKDKALIDGVANSGVGGACAFGAHVALGGEAGHKIVFGGLRGQKHAPGDGLFNGLQIFSAGMEKEMDMRVDEAGEQRGVAEVDNLCVLRMIDGSSNGANAVAFNEDFAGAENRASVNLQKARGMENDGRGGWLLRGGGDCDSEGRRCAEADGC
jgi:hypothetical protein